jgi:hypothetical protein
MKKEFLFRILSSMIILAAVFFIASCDDDDGDPIVEPDVLEVLEGDITSNITLDASMQYLLRGKVYVQSGATLTIPAGTILFGEKSTEGTLVISRGGKIDAQGTADNPVVMTSNAPLGFRNRGDWGGLVVLGLAYNSNGDNALVEGLAGAAETDNGLYGPKGAAAIDNDNSGTLKYVRIEFAGIDLSQDNELNSLTMGSVGSGTTIDHILVSYANDDAYEWFGGSVNQKYLIAYSTLDDDFDTDRGYNGKTQFAVVVRDGTVADISGSRAFESSSNSNAVAPTFGGTSRHSNPKFANVSVFGPLMFRAAANTSGNYRAAVEVNSFSQVELYNSIITGFPTSANFATAGSSVVNNIFSAHTAQTPIGANVPAEFATQNTLEGTITNIFGPFPSGSLYSFSSIPFFQHADSPYIADAPALTDEFFEDVAYYGAFGTAASTEWNWAAGWVNLDPNNADY